MEDSPASLYPAQKSHGYPSCWTHCPDKSPAQTGYTWWQNTRQLLIGWSISWLLVFCSAQQQHKCSELEELQAQIKSTAAGIFFLCNYGQSSYVLIYNSITWVPRKRQTKHHMTDKYLPQRKSNNLLLYKALMTMLGMQTATIQLWYVIFLTVAFGQMCLQCVSV